MKNIESLAVALTLATLTGCAAVPQGDINKRAEAMRSEIADRVAAQSVPVTMPLVERVRGSYLGGESVALAYDATLPAIFSDVTLAFPGRANLATVGERITAVTKIPVRLRPDVFITAKSLVRAGLPQAGAAQSGPPVIINPAVPPLPQARSQGPSGAGIAGQTFDDFDVRLPMDYSGSLSGYLDLICARLGINWEYKEGTIILYRMVTKVLTVKVNPGSVTFASGLSKGGGDGTKGSFSSTSSVAMNGDYNVWTSIDSAVKGMMSPLGSSTVDQAGGMLVITDTKEVVDNVSRYIEMENAVLTRHVNIAVRVIRVAMTDSTETGFDLNLIYKKLAAGATDWSFGMAAPSSLASNNAGALELNILKPGNRFQGSDILVKALNQFGTVLSDDTTTANTTNRVPVPIGKFSTTTYLAETKPASGGGQGGGGSGVPGLTPGAVTTGFFLNVLPTAFENNSVLMRVSLDQSVLRRLDSISTGSGETLQQIQTPEVDGTKSDHSVGLKDGESIVLMGISSDGSNADRRTSITGLSSLGKRTREMQLIVLTPKVSSGI